MMKEIIFWLSLYSILLIYVGYPMIIGALAFFFKGKHKIEDAFTPTVTLIIPAYNEERVIEEKLENSLALLYPRNKLQIIVIVDEGTDRSEEIVTRYIGKGIKLIIQRPRQGKMAAINKAIPQATGEVIVLSDANSMYKPDAIKKLVRHFNDEKIGLVCGRLKLINSQTLVGAGEGFYWRYENFLKEKESSLGQLLVVNGSIYAIRKELFSEINPVLADDFILPMRIAAAGYRLIFEPEAINEERISNTTQDQFMRKVRIVSQGMRAAFSSFDCILRSSALRIFEFAMHKFLRWFVFIFTSALLVSNILLLENGLYRMIFYIQLAFYCGAVIGFIMQKAKKNIKIFFIPFYFSLVNFAAFCGFLKFLFARQKATWEKAESTR